MQRDRSNLRPLSRFTGVCFVLLYEVATTQLRFLPPLIGVLFCYLVLEASYLQKSYEKFDISWYFALFLLVFSEQIHGFYLFSSVVAFVLFFGFVSDWLAPAIKWHGLLLAMYVASGYVWSFCVHNLIAYAKNEELLKFGGEYLFYIIIESIIALLFFKRRVP